MSEDTGIFSRVSRWFKRQFRQEEDLPLLYGQMETTLLPSRRSVFPWKRAGANIDIIESRLSAVTALMVALRSAIDQQTQRHDELLTYLSQLSHALQAIPDTSRVQSETLRVLHQQIAYQNAQYKQLAEVLRKVGDSDAEQHTIVEGLRERVENLYETDQTIRQTITGMDTAVRQVSMNSQTSTLVLERLRDNFVNHETDLDKSFRKQGRRMFIALIICMVLSTASIITVVMVVWRSLDAIEQLKQPQATTAPVVQQMPAAQPSPLPAPVTPVVAAPVPAPTPATPVPSSRPVPTPAAQPVLPATQPLPVPREALPAGKPIPAGPTNPMDLP